jgi:hypothetical protein
MPYDPRMMQMAQMGIGMMGPQQAGRPKQWWEQPAPGGRRFGQPADDQADPSGNRPGQQPQPSLLQMLMLGGKPTYSGTPPGPQQGNPWGWLGGMWGGGPGGGR